MPKLAIDELVRDLRARRIMVDGGNGNVYDIADEVCEQAADFIEKYVALIDKVRDETISRAEQACRYALKHQNFDGSNEYEGGWRDAAEVCEGAIAPHVRRHAEEDLKRILET